MAWGSMLKGVAKGAIQKKAKKKGAEMAKNITNKKEKDDSSAIVVREKSTSLVGPLLGGGDSTDSSANTSKKSGSPLDRIDSALKDIMKTLKSRRKVMLNKSRRMRVQDDKEKKGKREGLLEKMKTTGKNMVKSAASGAKGWWEKLQKFLLMTMLGALVIAIKENWEKIKEKIDKVVNFVQDLWKFMSPVLIPLFKALKWITVQGFKLIGNMLGMGKDKAQIDKGTDEATNELESIKKETEGVTKQFKESKKNINSITNTKEPNVDTKDTKKGEVEGKTAPLPKTNRDEVTTDKTIKSDLSTITFDGKTYPMGYTGPMETFGGKGGSTYKDEDLKQYNVGGYVTRDGEVHKGEYVVKESIVKKVGVTNIENVIKKMMLPGLGGGGGGTNAITDKATTKSLGKRGKDIGNLLARPFRDGTEADPRSKFASLSEYLPPVMMEKMEKTLTAIKEQTEYEDPAASTIIIRVPASAPQSGGGGGGSKTIAVPVGSTPKDTLNRYVNAVIQKALF